MSRRQNQLGKHGQDIAAIALRMRGILLVEAISTHALYIPHPSAKGYFRVVWDTPASGDHRGVIQLHHKNYKHLWREQVLFFRDTIPLCKSCHENIK